MSAPLKEQLGKLELHGPHCTFSWGTLNLGKVRNTGWCKSEEVS